MAEGCVLAVESSAPDGGGAALIREDLQLLHEAVLPNGIRSGQGLAPAVRACLQESEKIGLPLLGLAVNIGPGSYTGLRVGVIFAKTFAFGRNLPVCGIYSLDALAWQNRAAAGIILVATAARKDELYTAVYDCTENSARRRGEIQARSPEAVLPLLADLPAGVTIIGSGISQLDTPRLAEIAPGTCLGEPFCSPFPRAVAELGLQSLKNNPAGEPLPKLQPVYPRRENISMPILGEAVEKRDD